MPEPLVLHIRKYPNRRLYDQTRSRHLTVEELYEAVIAGHSVRVTDSRSDRDITNAVLLSALIERDPEKLAALPPEFVHLMLRATEGVLQSFLSQWFAQMIRASAAMGGIPGIPGMPGMAGNPMGTPGAWWAGAQPPPTATQPPSDVADDAHHEELRERIERLGREIDSLRSDPRLREA